MSPLRGFLCGRGYDVSVTRRNALLTSSFVSFVHPMAFGHVGRISFSTVNCPLRTVHFDQILFWECAHTYVVEMDGWSGEFRFIASAVWRIETQEMNQPKNRKDSLFPSERFLREDHLVRAYSQKKASCADRKRVK